LDHNVEEVKTEVLVTYNDYFTKYLTEADLVSIQLGGNDIVMSVIPDMVYGENPVLKAAGTSLMLTLFGRDPEIAIGAGLLILQENKDNITADDKNYEEILINNIIQNADALVDESAKHVKDVVKAVQEVNGGADIALVGMFNPYRTEESSEAMKEDIFEVLGNIYTAAAKLSAANENELTISGKPSVNYINMLSDKVDEITELKEVMDKYSDDAELEELLALVGEYDDMSEVEELKELVEAAGGDPAKEDVLALMIKYDDISELQSVINIVKNYDDVSELTELMAVMAKYRTASDTDTAKAMAEEIAAPIALQIAGRNVDPQMKRLNEELQVIAEETGAVYVDVYDISPEDDFDPHPNANGHKEIAGILYDNLSGLVAERAAGEPQVQDPDDNNEAADTRILGDVDGSGAIDSDDILYVAAHVFGLRPLTEDEAKYADIDGSGSIDLMDALILATYINLFSF
ncbi:dockerin type I domain-containing protein, partial [Ruminococcus sp.]